VCYSRRERRRERERNYVRGRLLERYNYEHECPTGHRWAYPFEPGGKRPPNDDVCPYCNYGWPEPDPDE